MYKRIVSSLWPSENMDNLHFSIVKLLFENFLQKLFAVRVFYLPSKKMNVLFEFNMGIRRSSYQKKEKLSSSRMK